MNSILFDGFYSAFMTGSAGTTFAIFVFKDGILAGTDRGGGKYDGKYEVSESEEVVTGEINIILPTGSNSITGPIADSGPIRFSVQIKIPTRLDAAEYIRVETPTGPINAKLAKLRDL